MAPSSEEKEEESGDPPARERSTKRIRERTRPGEVCLKSRSCPTRRTQPVRGCDRARCTRGGAVIGPCDAACDLWHNATSRTKRKMHQRRCSDRSV
ncbi:hypothetical protein NDU88_007081 [Pleurodeles waltl]|uniref:Uncharacterized protein n=1 Tax=Pleurodeles waltl TaxID=8319 RepID=A0AAV7URD7_PLEWA|nr:hypothetical protein NDU88_007081 [Pleurodeles waltl]